MNQRIGDVRARQYPLQPVFYAFFLFRFFSYGCLSDSASIVRQKTYIEVEASEEAAVAQVAEELLHSLVDVKVLVKVCFLNESLSTYFADVVALL